MTSVLCTHLSYTYHDSSGKVCTGQMPVYIMPVTAPPPPPSLPSSHCCSGTGLHRAVFRSTPQAYDHFGVLEDRMESSTILPPPGNVECISRDRCRNVHTPVAVSPTPFRQQGARTQAGIGYFHEPNISTVEERPISPSPSRSISRVLDIMQSSAEGRVYPHQPSRSSTADDDPPLYLLTSPLPKPAVIPDYDLKTPIRDHLLGATGQGTMQLALRSPPHLAEDPAPEEYQWEEFHQGQGVSMPTYCERLAASPLPIMPHSENRLSEGFHSPYLARDVAVQTAAGPEPGIKLDTDMETLIRTGSASSSWEFVSNTYAVGQEQVLSLPRAASSVYCSCQEALEGYETHLADCPAWEEVR